ncbi:NmrA/HSCARG family protein [Brasilonema sp. CT11]|nr:NmrA/HSCARG family protein [Brasilonema sp. CT11]
MNGNKPILVTGATGAQGSTTIDALLNAGFAVRALVRNPRSTAAQALAARGVELLQGDFDDASSLNAAATGAFGVFSVQVPPRLHDPDSELRAGHNLVEAARQANIDTFVHTSVARAGDQETFIGCQEGRWDLEYWNSKSGVNDMVRIAGFAHWVILKPAFMMDNFIPPKAAGMFPLLSRGVVNTVMSQGTKLDLIAASDVGRFAAAVFAEPTHFNGQEIDLAAESLNSDEIAEVICRATGKRVVARNMSPEKAVVAGASAGLVKSQEWASVEGYKVDIGKAKSYGIALESFEEWTRRHRDDFAVNES